MVDMGSFAQFGTPKYVYVALEIIGGDYHVFGVFSELDAAEARCMSERGCCFRLEQWELDGWPDTNDIPKCVRVIDNGRSYEPGYLPGQHTLPGFNP